jgi:hypothetical protein
VKVEGYSILLEQLQPLHSAYWNQFTRPSLFQQMKTQVLINKLSHTLVVTVQERKSRGQVMVKAGLVELSHGAWPELSINFEEIVSPAHGNF